LKSIELLNNWQSFFSPTYVLAQKWNLEKNSIYSNKFFHNFHLSESSFTCHGLRESGLAWKLIFISLLFTVNQIQLFQWREICHYRSDCYDQRSTTLDGKNGVGFLGCYTTSYLCRHAEVCTDSSERSSQEVCQKETWCH